MYIHILCTAVQTLAHVFNQCIVSRQLPHIKSPWVDSKFTRGGFRGRRGGIGVDGSQKLMIV